MSNHRFNELQLQYTPLKNLDSKGISENLFASAVFNREKLQSFLTERALLQMDQCIEKRNPIPPILADQIAMAMKAWALSKGVKHFSHWVQPLTGLAADKQDSFFSLDEKGKYIEKFDGEQLVQKVPYETGLPGGSTRDTFEARGYTAWDPTSPAFIYDLTLYLPTTFISYTGEALDYKSPLLKSTQKIDEIASEICRYFDKNTQNVTPTLGWEQEYFLIDRKLVLSRPDLVLTGRTLIGQSLPKGQQSNPSFFEMAPNRVSNFLKSVEHECVKLGIPIKTRHNEVAPSQYEIAQVFGPANLAVDHNALLMNIMHKIAYQHDFCVLFHEKPFDKINGSSKHSNWSLITDTGLNLLSPSKTPMGNLQFLSFFVNTIAAVLKHEAVLRASTVSASNDLRMGQDEAPSTMLSIFVGKHLLQVLEELEHVSEGKLSPQEKSDLKLNVIGKIPEILLDNTDRDRTSPFAFTGNKFEIRTVGSKSNAAKTITVINAIVAEQLHHFKRAVDKLIDEKDMKKDDAIFNTLRETISTIKDELLDGGISESKNKKPKAQPKHQATPDALFAYLNSTSITLFEGLEIFSKKELTDRLERDLEHYVRILHLEARTLKEIAQNQIIPATVQYQTKLIENYRGIKEVFSSEVNEMGQVQKHLIDKISKSLLAIHYSIREIDLLFESVDKTPEYALKAKLCAMELLPLCNQIRLHCDSLEEVVEDSLWPIVKYRELLFIR
ncbi:MAG: glutamine synthetase III [Flavobacteriaceae bacterium]